MINKIVMHGFKSFANKTEIVLKNDFNCILGPNGSGKSNVLDALCFVLGKSSSKSLRAEKSANLIYNGGKSKQPAKEATVSIYFNNSAKIFPVDDPEVSVTRSVKQSGSSVYKINKKTVTRNQVLELLSHARINPEGYNIVLQGDIVRLVEMSSIERRKIIEEIAGISVYEEKKQRAINELNKVEEKLKESDIILAERQTYLKELGKERNQAIKFKDLDEKIRRNKATIVHRKLDLKHTKKSQLEKDMDARKDSIAKLSSDIETIRQDIEKHKQIINDINKEIEEKGDKDQVKIQKQVEELRVFIGTNKSRINTVENELVKIAERKLQLEHSITDLDQKIDNLNKEKQNYKTRIAEKQNQINVLKSKIVSFKEKHKLSDSSDLEKEIEHTDKTADEKLAEIQALREKQQELLREKDRLEYQVTTADEKISKVLEIQKEHQKELDRLQQVRKEFKKATLELNTKLNNDASLVAQLANARTKLLKTKEDLAKIRAQEVGLRESSAADIAVQKVMQLKNKGVHGTVASLAEVSSDHAVALEVAAGNRIKSIVVDTDKIAADCIKYLKENKFGSATFLPLNKLKGFQLDANVKKMVGQPGVRDMAVNLVRHEPAYKNIFSYVFGNTLVVDNIDVARRVGVGSYRMVTMDGDLADISGAMHGGYRKKTGSSFQAKEVVKQIKQLEKQENDYENIVSALEHQKQESEESISRLRNLKAELEAEIIKTEKSLHIEDSDLDVSKNLKKDLKLQIDTCGKELNDISMKVSRANSELAAIKIKKQAIREKINALKNPALLAELNTFEQKTAELKEEILKLNSDISNIEVQITTILDPEIGNTRRILKQHEKEEKDFGAELKNLTALIKTQETELSRMESHQKEFYSKFKELFKKRDGVAEKVNKFESKLYDTEAKRRDYELKLNVVSLDNAKLSAEIEGLKEEYKQYEGVPIFKDKNEEDIKKEIWEFERMLKDIGAVNMRALEIYDQVEKEYNKVVDKKQTLTKEREDVMLMMNEIETKKKDLFMTTYEVINDNFKNKFNSLSTKGEATLELEDPETVFEGGLNIKVRLVGKKFLDIRGLSGGEKTLTALAFLFAVQDHEPAPFYVLDEVDAALDKRNSEKLALLVRQYVDKAQYLVISHNDGIISEADTLYGVSMNEHGISKVVSLRI